MNSVPREVYELFHKYGKVMAAQDYPLGPDVKMVLDTEDGVFGTKNGVNFDNLKWKDIVKMADGHLSTWKSGMKARVISQTPYCQQCLREGVEFQAVLDDMAMIVGPEAVIVNMTIPNKKKASMQMAKAVTNATGFFVQDRIRDGLPAGYTLTVGRNLYEAVTAMTILEKCAEIALKSRVLGGYKPVGRWKAKQLRSKYMESYSKAEAEVRSAEMQMHSSVEEEDELEEYEREFYGVKKAEPADAGDAEDTVCEDSADAAGCPWDEKETQLRQTLVDYGNRLVETGLVQGTWGNLSIRLDDQYMLVTPSGLDYTRLTAADMVKVHIATQAYEGELKPTSEKGLHAEIYKRRPDVGAVVHTQSRYCSIFAAANQDMPVEDGDAQEVFGTVVRLAKYAGAGTDKLARNSADALGDNFGCIMANHGMLTCGEDMETAFIHCQLMEQCAGQYIETRWK